jgi:prepilin-type N-terminal cleavage/methylation domain-containing protein
MDGSKGFTLSELMVVVLIVGILIAVIGPFYRGRVDAARWSEGKTTMGTIARSLEVYASEKGASGNYGNNLPTLEELGFTAGDLQGMYFDIGNYAVDKASYKKNKLKFKIKATAPADIKSPREITLDEKGRWKEKK